MKAGKPRKLTTTEKRNRLARNLEVLAAKLRNPHIGEELWDSNEVSMTEIVRGVHDILTAAADMAAEKAVGRTSRSRAIENDEWPEILYNSWRPQY